MVEKRGKNLPGINTLAYFGATSVMTEIKVLCDCNVVTCNGNVVGYVITNKFKMCEKNKLSGTNTLAYFGAKSAMNEIKVLCDCNVVACGCNVVGYVLSNKC